MSTINVGTIKSLDSNPPIIENSSGVDFYLARAWVNFNGTGTVAIRASGNVSSITDGGIGVYTVNFTTAMPDANYAYAVSFGDSIQVSMLYNPGPATTNLAFSTNGWNNTAGNNGALRDFSSVAVAIFR